MVELAIVLPLLLLLVLGVLEYGWLFLNMQRATNAARHGARIAAALSATPADGEAAIDALLDGVPVASRSVVLVEGDMVEATVTLNTADIDVVKATFLPVPDTLRAVVRLAKEHT